MLDPSAFLVCVVVVAFSFSGSAAAAFMSLIDENRRWFLLLKVCGNEERHEKEACERAAAENAMEKRLLQSEGATSSQCLIDR